MKYLFLFCLLGSWMVRLHAQAPVVSALNYSIFTVPDSLKKDAAAVYRLEEGILDVQSPSKYVVTYHYIVTLLNKDAAHHLRQRFYFDKVNKIENVEIKLFDAAGTEVKRYRKKDFEIINYHDNVSMIVDDKVMKLDIPPIAYPFTLEFTSQTSNSSYIELPDWRPGSIGEAVQSGRFAVRVPKQLDIQYKSWLIPRPYITVTDNIKTYQWEIKNRMASKVEAGGYEARFRVPHVQIVPAHFEYEGLKGQLNSWENLGKWMYPLYEDAKAFSPFRQEAIKALVKDCTSDREKIKALYEHLQKNMRYVSIQLGIGGFKPFPVSFVDDKKYGDCKALTNYMRYMLKTVGINAWPALINAGAASMPVDPSFPADVFNHVILCVPTGKDSVWLECTSNSLATGLLGTFTENKYALLLTDQGGKLVPTPKSNSKDNRQVTTTTIHLNTEGGATVTSNIYCTGECWDNTFYYIFQENKDELRNYFVKRLQYKSPDVFELGQPADSSEGTRFQLKADYEQLYDFKAGPKFFLMPRIHPVCLENVPLEKDRKDEYLFSFPYEKTDTTIFILPPGFQPDILSPVKTINSQYGRYRQEMSYDAEKRTLKVIASLSLRYHIIPPADYAGVAEFFHDVNKHESEKLVLKTE